MTAERSIAAPFVPVRDLLLQGPAHDIVAMVVETAGGGSLGHTVVIQFSPPSLSADAGCWPVSWAPQTKRRLLPAFEGALLAASEPGGGTRIRLTGSYTPPLGLPGIVFDAVIGKRVARQSIDRFTDHLAARLANELQRRADRSPWHPWTAPPDLNPRHNRAIR